MPAWGDNPIGLDAVPGLIDALEMVGLVLLAGGMVAGLAAFVTRWVRYRGPRRQQMAWFTIGVVVQVTGLATDTGGDSVTVEVLLAMAIFGTMLFGIGWPLLGPLGSRAEAAEHVAWAKSEAEPAPLASSVDGPTVATERTTVATEGSGHLRRSPRGGLVLLAPIERSCADELVRDRCPASHPREVWTRLRQA